MSNLLRAVIIAAWCGLLPFGLCSAGEIKVALDTPPDLEQSGTYNWAKAFQDHLKANGLAVKEYPRYALGGEEEKLDQVSQGLLEVSLSDLAKAAALEPSVFGFNMPYLFNSTAHLDQVLAKTEIMKKINASLAKKGVRILAMIMTGDFSGLANTKKPIKSPADAKGMRLRAMDKSQAEYLQAWGANVVLVPWSEIYNALQTGVADGYLNAAVVPVLFKHTEVIKFYSEIKYALPLRIALCSEKWYAVLSAKDRAIVDEAVVKATAANRAWQVKVAKSGLETLAKTGIQIYVNTPEELAEFAKLIRPVYTKVVAKDVADTFIKAAEANK
jgi:TRAP-type C4-dicarboxylate transport system substrate-binding protein